MGQQCQPTYILGLYAGDKYQISDNLILDYGLRYDSYEYHVKNVDGSVNKFRDGEVSPKAMISYNIDERQSVSLAVYQNARVPAANEHSWFSMASDPSGLGRITRSPRTFSTLKN